MIRSSSEPAHGSTPKRAVSQALGMSIEMAAERSRGSRPQHEKDTHVVLLQSRGGRAMPEGFAPFRAEDRVPGLTCASQ
jgi:hypothetical protein